MAELPKDEQNACMGISFRVVPIAVVLAVRRRQSPEC
jgi:hypothetical protein